MCAEQLFAYFYEKSLYKRSRYNMVNVFTKMKMFGYWHCVTHEQSVTKHSESLKKGEKVALLLRLKMKYLNVFGARNRRKLLIPTL